MTINDLIFEDFITQRNGHQFYLNNSRDMTKWDNKSMKHRNNSDLDIMKVQRLQQIFLLETIYERKEEILTDEEKDYLSKVIEPFRNKVKNIAKNDFEDYEFICIEYDDEICGDLLNFPTFKKGSMYINMELNKEYSLEELGL